MDGVPADPLDCADATFGIVVDAGSVPALVVEGLQRAGEGFGCLARFTGDIRGLLLVVALLDDSLVSAHGRERGLILGKGEQHALVLHAIHIAHVACILERRPHVRKRMRAEHVVVIGEHSGVPCGQRPQRTRDVVATDVLVYEAALVATLHAPKVPAARLTYSLP